MSATSRARSGRFVSRTRPSAARALGRPVKWTADRFESFLADHHGRDHEFVGELALDAKGHFLAARFTGYGNMGAYLGAVSPLMSTLNIVKNAMSVYRTPLIEVSTKCMFTNTMMVSAYRGAGRPEGNYYMERLIDAAAAEMDIDRLSLRRRNHVRPSEMPTGLPFAFSLAPPMRTLSQVSGFIPISSHRLF